MVTKLPPYQYGPTKVTPELFHLVQDAIQAGETVRSIRGRLRGEGFRFSNQAISDIHKEIAAMGKQRVRYIRNDARPRPIKSGRTFSSKYRYYGVAYYTIIDLEGHTITHKMEHAAATRRGRLLDGKYCEQELPLMFQDHERLTGRLIRERLESLAESSIQTMNLNAVKYEAATFILERVEFTNFLESR